MMLVVPATLARWTGTTVSSNLTSLHQGLAAYGREAGLDQPQRLAIFLAQVGHESGGFRFDREVWGPSAAQARYDTRTDLGNTPEADGDGYRNRGRTAMQITGGFNIGEFRDWCRENVDPHCPDFLADPELMNTDPWEGLGPVWFWSTRQLNHYADEGNHEMVTRRINGGLNGYEDRLIRYGRIALEMVGFGKDVRAFQRSRGLLTDGICGPRTRAALHKELSNLGPVTFNVVPGPTPFTDWLNNLLRDLGLYRDS